MRQSSFVCVGMLLVVVVLALAVSAEESKLAGNVKPVVTRATTNASPVAAQKAFSRLGAMLSMCAGGCAASA